MILLDMVLSHVKRLQEPGMKVPESFVSQVPSHTIATQEGAKLQGFSAEYSMSVLGGKWDRGKGMR